MSTVARPVAGRRSAPSAYCEGCQARLTYGDPKESESWPGLLSLDAETYNLMLEAAAEYHRLSLEANESESAVDFVDWLDAVSRQRHRRFDHDGAPARNESGTISDHSYRHRHPDPLPFTSLPRTWER